MSKKRLILLILISSMLIILYVLLFPMDDTSQETISLFPTNDTSQGTEKILTVHYLDVGQADSILIQLPNNEIALIDAGNNDDSKFILDYIKALDIKKIDYIVGTHPHEDHVGSLDSVINTFDIGKIYMPRATATTKTFEDVLQAVQKKGLQINTAKAGVNILSADGMTIDIIAPINEKYDDLNNYSAVVKLIYGNTSFIFTGDAESISEKEMLDNNAALKADVLKVGHHGSGTSSSSSFLKAVSPRYAVISCGVDNDYGHPHKNALDRLGAEKIEIYRTDHQGTIIAVSDGKEITFTINNKAAAITSAAPSKQPATTAPTAAPKPSTTVLPASTPTENTQPVTVYILTTGNKYHLDGCTYLNDSKTAIDLEKAKNQGYTPCSRCKPPA